MNTFVADPALSNNGSMLVNQIEVDQEPLPTGDNTLMEVRVTNQEGEHETAVVTTKLAATEVDSMKEKTIAFTYGPRLNLGTFYGYVNEITASKTYQQDGMYDMTCFGPTNSLQQGKPRFYESKTVPQMVADVVTSHRLGVQVDEHPFVWPTYAQTDDTDWGFIVDAAADLGWAIYNFNGVVRLVDPLRILSSTGPILRLVRGNDILDQKRQLLDFMPSSKSQNLAGNMKPVFGFFEGDKVTLNQPLDSTHRLYTDAPVFNRDMAHVASSAWDHNPTMWTQQAQGRIEGNPSVLPGSVVDIQSTGSSVIEHDYDGLWLIRGVQHVLTNKSFQTLVTLARDDQKRKTNVDYRPFWSSSTYGKPQVVRNGDVWESSWKKVSTQSSSLNPTVSPTSNYIWKVSS